MLKSDSSGRSVLDLSGQRWQFEGIRPGEGTREGFHEHFSEICPSMFNWNGAEVPGDVYTDLWRAGVIDDPHYGRNGMKAKWVLEREWWYRCAFGVPEEWRGQTVRLRFDGVDYSCDVWLNGVHLGHHEGMFSPFEFVVDSLLRYQPDQRANALAVRLNPPPRSYRHVAGRKFAWHGDYWRTLVPIGIWRPVRLIATGPVSVEDLHPVTKLHPDGSATVRVEMLLTHFGDTPVDVGVRIVTRGKNVPTETYEVGTQLRCVPGENRTQVELHIPDAQLWWPWDLGPPNLYTLQAVVDCSPGGPSDNVEITFGIREIRMERNPGYSPQEVHYPWTLIINGKRTFLRSANWGGPPDIFYGRNSEAKYRRLIQLAREANLNNLRIFGWHPPEVDLFYRLCDEMGITVWQDLIPLASVVLPQDEAFRQATYAEAVAVIKRLRNHPSLVLLEGGEEMFYGSGDLASNAEFLRGLETAIRPYTSLPYVPTSPLNWPPIVHELGLGGPKDSAHTHELFYGMGERLLEEIVPEWDYAAIPEFAVSSIPDVESLRRFIPPEELWPPGPSWGYHWADLDAFRALNFQIFGDERIGSLEEFVEATQVAQGVIFQFGIEHVRRRKPKSSAIAICHFITYAPDMKWGIVDYFQRTKRSYEYIKRAYQPVLVSLKLNKRRWMPGEELAAEIWITNDLHTSFAECLLQLEITDATGHSLRTEHFSVGTIPPDSSQRYGLLRWKVAGRIGETFHLRALLRDSQGQELSENAYFLLIGDQDEARRLCQERARRFRAIKLNAHGADYYRFYPALSGPDRAEHFGPEPPKVDFSDVLSNPDEGA